MIVSSLGGGMFQPFRATVPTLIPNCVAAARLSGEIDVRVEGVMSDAEYCSESSDLFDFCLSHTQSALSEGLTALLASYGFTIGAPGYSAVLRVTDFTHYIVSEAAGGMSIAWQYVLSGPDGVPIVTLAERTPTPQPISGRGDFEASARRMLEAVLERISAETNRALAAPQVAASAE